MVSKKKVPERLAVFWSICLLLAVGAAMAIHSKAKLFWSDEGADQFYNCGQPLLDIWIHGARAQCSSHPLYYFLQNTWTQAVGLGEQMHLVFRTLSMLAGVGVLAVIARGLWPLGAWVTGLGSLAFLDQPLFWQYASENRPYMLWLMFFGLLITSHAKSLFEAKPTSKTLTWASIGITLTSGAGWTQAVSAILFYPALECLRSRRVSITQYRRPLLLSGFCILLGLYYLLIQSCQPVDSPFNLWKTRDPHLVLGVLRLLWVKGGISTQLVNLLFVMGLVLGLREFLRTVFSEKRNLSLEQALGVSLVLQLFVAAVLAVLVVMKGHFFVSRVFIYLIALRAIGAALGFYWILRRFKSPKAVRGTVLLISASLLVSLSTQVRTDLTTIGIQQEKPLSNLDCPKQLSSLKLWIKDGPARFENASNGWVWSVQRFKGCEFDTQTKSTQFKNLLLDFDGGARRFEVTDSPPNPGLFKPLSQCGNELNLPPELNQ